MLKQFSQYQINGLIRLINFKSQFKTAQENSKITAEERKKQDPLLKAASQQFIEIFCSHNLADTDYGTIQMEPYHFDSFEQWIEQTNLETIIKSLTYIIWTDKIIEGYMPSKIKDSTLFLLLQRLEHLLRTQWEVNLIVD